MQTDKGEKLAQLMQEAHVAKREKEDALYRLEQVNPSQTVADYIALTHRPDYTCCFFNGQVRAENEEMRKSLQEAVRIKSDYEHLKQVFILFVFLSWCL